ncbi:tripartite tricarboxylate transporter substrate binding protein [Roseomonas stagni]|uniref:Tripartite tricarboxylate transporter substrate binding protein n=1 Tax=Falsiroseomonas algicola TaxID=2716930 RepID=A0A6M1LL47_9PROT|nr:tripartite tricarboxylate transporter substrate binding protein [Falsiroseomonas algicola]NGM20927.1 tripartite tricarboxylate transporter substrate binding protein [Falsiroseomonas algicola]
MTVIKRRTLLAASAVLPLPALAQGAWPARPIRLVVPFAPGGTTDIVARILAANLQERLGQPVVSENRPGAGATLASAQVAQAAPDGYTLVVSNSASHGISPTLFRNVRYDSMTDFTHIALAATTSTAIVVNPRYEAQSIADLIRIGRARPDGLDFAISGHGTTTHLLGMRIGLATGIRMNPILYRGAGPALIDVIAGTVGLFVDGLPSSIPHLRDGTLKAIAVADAQRNRHLPNVPTLGEQGLPNMTSYSWFGVSGPKGMAPAVVERLNTEIRAILQLPAVRQRYNELTADAPDMSPAQYAAFIEEEVRVWGEVVRATGATAD